ncbi:MAG: Flp pilus assembly complex ATPase component TadA [Planctomycetes bacterium]|nr:Flp pilus assembly complex ATPase component TadA [Planctomycetota bacterium]
MEMGFVDEAQVEEALKVQEDEGGKLGDILVKLGYVAEPDILFAVAEQTGMEVADLDDTDVDPGVIDMVPRNIVETYRVCPVGYEAGVLVVALADPMNPTVLDDLRFMTNCEVRGAVSTPDAVDRAVTKYYGGKEDTSLADAMAQAINADDIEAVDEGGKKLQDISQMVESTPVVKLVNLILLQAIKDKAADIHLEPFENSFKVRQRIDGVLYEIKPPPPPHLATALCSRIKVMAGLDIAERRLPQDGRIELNVGGRPVDIRVSTLPVVFGEAVVMRILDRSNVNLDLNNLGIRPKDLEVIKALINKPNGVILVTGPTGSGKTTTLYSALSDINTIDRKIITNEDPVEYDLPGIIQVPINPEVEMTYAKALRAILRQDPDVIFVGEIRDLETASICVEAALTGHLVLSTLHTNDAPSVVTRLVDLGVEPFLLSAVLEGVIAQRLVRKICVECKVQYSPQAEELYELGLKPEMVQGRTFFYGEGCKVCNNTGYKSRQAIFEMFIGTENLKTAVANKVPLAELKKTAKKEGMRTLREAGIIAIYEGTTTIEEIVKETVFH